MTGILLARLRLGVIGLALIGLGGCTTMLRNMQKARMAQMVASGERFQEAPAADAWDAALLSLAAAPKDRAPRTAEQGAALVVLDDTRRVTHTWLPTTYQNAHRAHLISPMTHVDERRALLILNAAGVGAASVKVVIPSGAYLSGFDAVTYTPDGREIRLKAPKLVPLAAYPGELAARILLFAFPHAEPGAVVTWRYRISSLGYRPLDTWRLPEHLPVRAAKYTLQSYEFVAMDAQVAGVEAQPKRVDASKIARTWTAADLPWIPREPFQTAPVSGRARVSIVLRDVDGHPLFPDWANVLNGVRERAADMFIELPSAWWAVTPPETGRPAAALHRVHADLARGSTPLHGRHDTLIALHRYRRANPLEQSLAAFMLLRHWGVGCDLIYTTPEGTLPILRNFARPHRDARLLLSCDDTLLDPSCRSCAPGVISRAVRGRPAVRLVKGGVRFITLPNVQDPVVQWRLTVQPEARGLVAEKGEMVVNGASAASVRAWFVEHPLPPKAQSDEARRRFLDDIDAESISIGGLDTPGTPVRFGMTNVVVSRNGWTRTDAWMAAPFDVLFSEGIFRLAQVETRTAPVRLQTNAGFDNRADVRTPTGWTLTQMPDPFALKSPFGAYTFTVKTSAKGPRFSETLQMHAQSVDPARWPALREFLRAIETHRHRLITWRKEG